MVIILLKLPTVGYLVKNRHNIAWNKVCGESNDVNIDSVNECKSKISEYVKDYDACNIYNCDETGLFFVSFQIKH